MNDFYYLVGIKCLKRNNSYNEIELITIDEESYFVVINFDYFWETESYDSIYKNLCSQRYKITNNEMLEFFLKRFSSHNPRTNYIINKKYYSSYLKESS